RGRLRTIRRAAGAARDWDVFLLDLRDRQASAGEKEQAGLEFLIAYALGQRSAAQVGLEALAQPIEPSYPDFVGIVVGDIRPDDTEQFGDLAQGALTELFAQLTAGAEGDLTDYEHLHQVRITGKRLRYAMEVFSACFSTELREKVYPRIEEMQE